MAKLTKKDEELLVSLVDVLRATGPKGVKEFIRELAEKPKPEVISLLNVWRLMIELHRRGGFV